MSIRIADPQSEEDLKIIQTLLRRYSDWRDYDIALGDFDAEVAAPFEAYERILIASDSEKPSGMVAFRKMGPYRCEMKRLWVLPEQQERGIGMALIKAILDQARSDGYEEMFLDTHPSMREARSLYHKVRFRECARYNQNPTPGIRFFKLNLRD